MTTSAVRAVTAGRERRARLPRGLALAVLLLVICYFSAIFVWPAIQAFWYGLNVIDVQTDTSKFVGLRHFERMMVDDRFWLALRISVIYVACVIVVQLTVSLALGAMYVTFRGVRKTLVIALFFLPAIVPNLAAVIAWKSMVRPGDGLFDQALRAVGLPPADWSTDPLLIMSVMVGFTAWKYAGSLAVIWMSGLNAIPAEIYEAAEIDGAGRVRQFFALSLPLLRPLLAFIVIVSIIDLVQFIEPFLALRLLWAPPGTESLILYIYTTAFQGLNFGYGAAMTVALFAILLVLSAAQLRAYRSQLRVS